jgi:hypothetical protein
MTLVALIDVRCPWCDKALGVRETILVDIFRCLRETAMDAEHLTLVCPGCKAAFPFDYRERLKKAVGMTALQPQSSDDYIWFSIQAECDDSNCKPPRILFAIRPIGTTQRQLSEESHTWNLSGLVCEHRHPIVRVSLVT